MINCFDSSASSGMACMAWRRDSAALAKSAASRRAISARKADSLAADRLVL
ncbi:hypothetical protein D3C80_2074030 [compost metagenome]